MEFVERIKKVQEKTVVALRNVQKEIKQQADRRKIKKE